MPLEKDLRDFIASLNSQNVEYLIVGGFALAYHGVPRFTADLDFLVRPSSENAERLERAISGFGFASLGLTQADFTRPNRVIQLGLPPNRIDLLTSLTGVGFDDAWAGKIAADLDGLPVWFIGRNALIRNKRATGRVRDLADLEALGEALDLES